MGMDPKLKERWAQEKEETLAKIQANPKAVAVEIALKLEISKTEADIEKTDLEQCDGGLMKWTALFKNGDIIGLRIGKNIWPYACLTPDQEQSQNG